MGWKGEGLIVNKYLMYLVFLFCFFLGFLFYCVVECTSSMNVNVYWKNYKNGLTRYDIYLLDSSLPFIPHSLPVVVVVDVRGGLL